MSRNRDFGKKPYMQTEEDNYQDMVKYNPLSQNQDPRYKKHSEFLKPYGGAADYPEMENFSPVQFQKPYTDIPNIDIPSTGEGEPNPCEALRHIAFGAKQVWYEIPCGGTLSINNSFEGGLPPYIVIASPLPMNGSLSCDEQGNCYYRAPSECCADITDNIYIQDVCGRSANIIIIVKAFDYSISNYQTVIIGPDAPVDGDCYYLQTYVPNTIWSIDKGAIDSSGCVSGLSGECGVATITATFMCLDNEIIATKKVRMPNGVWISIYSTTLGGACYTTQTEDISGILRSQCKFGCTSSGNGPCTEASGLPAGFYAAGGTCSQIGAPCCSCGTNPYSQWAMVNVDEWRCA